MEKSEFLEMYYQGFSDTKIAKILNIDRHNIHKLRKSLNLPRASFVTFYKDSIIKLVNKGYSDQRISKLLNISKSMVGYIRKKLGIKTNFIERTYKTREDRLKGYMIRQIKYSAKRRNIEFDLTYEDIKLPRYCPLLELKLDYESKNASNPLHPSIDRIDNTKGYIKDNIIVLSRQANAMKNEATSEQLRTFSKNLINFLDFFENQGARGDITNIFPNKEELSLDL